MSKTQLYAKLKEQFNYERLQRANSRLTGKRSLIEDSTTETEASTSNEHRPYKKAKRAKSELNKIDPIMLGPLSKHTYKFMRGNGTCVLFNLDSLIDYFLATGDFSDPETRIPFSDQDLKNIDKLAAKAGMKKPSVFNAKKNPQNYADQKFRRDALQGLERLAGDVIAEMYTILEECDPDEAEMRLVMREMPMFADLFRQMRDADPAYAGDAMRHYKLYVRGPPNRPTEDPYGLLEIILHFLSRCESGNGQEFGY